MGLTRMAKSCRNCPFAEVKAPLMAEMAAPILRETKDIVIDGNVVKVYKDEIEKELYKQLYSHLGLQIGG